MTRSRKYVHEGPHGTARDRKTYSPNSRLTATLAERTDALVCSHDHRVHYLGGGLYVCFACFVRMVIR